MRAHVTAACPVLIQGGMGVAVSGWRLASAVARAGQLGVVSGTASAVVLARRLQDGDPGGHLRQALRAFPAPEVAERIIARYFKPDGRPPGAAYRAVPVPRHRSTRAFLELTVAASFSEVRLAKTGHDGPIGINLLEKIQIPTLPTLYGALLAGVDYVLMGAGLPRGIPRVLDLLSRHTPAAIELTLAGGDALPLRFDPQTVVPEPPRPARRPRFLAIVASHALAALLVRDDGDRPDGFVIERPTAGGHNAPPRGRLQLDAQGEPQYGPRDEVDLGRLRDLGLPFWLAGGYGDPARLREAHAAGAAGVQVGTAFALCAESGLDPALRHRALERARTGELRVRTDPVASPTGFPFKVAQLAGTIAEDAVLAARERRCDLGYLTTAYRRPDGGIGYRCPAEPVADYVAKGGRAEDTEGRRCLCNGLTASAGVAQRRAGEGEPALVTLGDDACRLVQTLAPEGGEYAARDVVRYVLGC
ncbi:MAG TPA: nitronate monooxygenase [Solirubrobacter sp.]|nr:nitronate monooxygenase [Solirubrobacter sp.]